MSVSEHDPHAAAAVPSPDWTAVVSHAVEGLGRIVRAEIGLFELALRSGLEAQLYRAALLMAALVAASFGALCLLAALVLLLHRWSGVWWIAFAATGALAMVIALAVSLAAGRLVARPVVTIKD